MNQIADWITAVDRYTVELRGLVETIDERLDSLRLSTVESGPSKIEPSLIALAQSLQQLETMVVRRDELIRDAAAPADGVTLVKKLLSTRRIDAAALADRCRRVSASVEAVHNRATSLFVCHHHLHALTVDMVRTVTGDRRSETYDRGGASSVPPQGGVFDDAA